MKRFACFMIVSILIFLSMGCAKNPGTSETPNTPSVFTDNSSKEIQNSSQQETTSSTEEKNTSTSSTSSSLTTLHSSSVSSNSKTTTVTTQSEKTTKPEPAPQLPASVLLTSDTSRAQSTDIASMIEDGYIYYSNKLSNFPTGLFRKKINGGSEEKIADHWAFNAKILNGKVYYLAANYNLYSCDTDGQNVKTLDSSGMVSSFDVAGNWVFVTRTIGTSSISRAREELYIISTDGSQSRQIKPNAPNDAGSQVVIHGFNRGYCYLTVTNDYYTKGSTSSISFASKRLSLRIDYRSATLTQHDLNASLSYTHNGELHYSYDLGDHSIYYDRILQTFSNEKISVSLIKNTTTPIAKKGAGVIRLRDYYVYEESNNPTNYKLCFVDLSGNSNLVTVDLSDNGTFDMCTLDDSQDIHNNQLFVVRVSYQTYLTELLMITPNGEITKIYSKTP